MSVKLMLNWADIDDAASNVAKSVRGIRLYGVPRGGIHAAAAVARHIPKAKLVSDPALADTIIDDIVDSGRTRQRMNTLYPLLPFHALYKAKRGVWLVFPWEAMSDELGPEQNILRVLEYIGEDPHREGLKETPARVVRSWKEIFSGYAADPGSVLKTFRDGACDEMVVLRDIEFYSTCEHHMQPFFGRAHIGYIPNGRVVGVSKLARLLEVFTRRLQIQERIGQQVTEALMKHLKPLGCGCVLYAQHLCMTCRGVGKQNSVMMTSSLKGKFMEPAVRDEFLRMAGL